MTLSQIISIILILLLTIGNIGWAFLAHIIYRAITGWRKYKTPSVAEDIFILVFTYPLLAGGGYVLVTLPLGIGLFLGAEPFITLRTGDALESVIFHAIWLIVVLSFIILKRRRFKNKLIKRVDNKENKL